MHTMSDWELIQHYAKNRSEAAFAELVRRHLSWVYSVALRRIRQAALQLGHVTSAQFDQWVRPEEMTHPLQPHE